jgi:small-conductance mechanosensitive channel
VLFFIAIGLLVEKGFKIVLRQRYLRHDPDEDSISSDGLYPASVNNIDKFSAVLVTVLPDIAGLFVFFGSAYFSYFTFVWTKSSNLQLLFLSLLLTVTLTRVVAIISQLVFSPASDRFRILPVSPHNALLYHRLFIGIGFSVISAMMLTVVIFRLGAERSTVSLLAIFFATILLLLSALLILIYKKRVKDSILETANRTPSWGRRQFASLWHVPALLYLFLLWILLINNIDAPPHANSRAAFVISFFILPIWIIADRFIQWIVRFLMTTLNIYDDTQVIENPEANVLQLQQGRMWYGRCNTAARLSVVGALTIWVACLWGLHVPYVSNFTSVFFDASIILALSLLLWKLISTWIERKIAESTPEESEESTEDDEWGGAAARGRSYTLLPMIRKFLGSILVVMVSMMILSSMGVDIGPLLAGAGVIGLAIGFGAQKLVADIFSGFVYLLDDAF